MPTLIFDKGTPLSEQRMAVSLSKCGRNKKKNHATSKRKSHKSRERARAAKKASKDRTDTKRAISKVMSAYFHGEVPDLSAAMKLIRQASQAST